MYNQSLMATGILYEVSKDRLRLTHIFERLEALIEDKLPDDEPETAACTNNILCTRQGVRHRSGCYGKPYANRLW